MNEATSRPLAAGTDDVWAAVEAVKFGGADALVVTKDDGVEHALEAIDQIRRAVPGVPLLVGGRVSPATIAATRAGADGAIIGSALKPDADPFSRVTPHRARRSPPDRQRHDAAHPGPRRRGRTRGRRGGCQPGW